MWKKMKKILALGLTAALLLAGCGPSQGAGGADQAGQPGAAGGTEGTGGSAAGGTANGQEATGRYMESAIALPEEVEYAMELRHTADGVEIFSMDGTLYRSRDQGQSWQQEGQAPEELKEQLSRGVTSYFRQNQRGDTVSGYIQFGKDAEGNTDYNVSSFVHVLFLADGTRIPLDIPEQEFISEAVCDGEGVFYLGVSGSGRIYRLDGQDGSLEVLTEAGGRCDYLTVCGKYLMIQGDELQIYGLEENTMMEPDPVLSEFLEPCLGQYGDEGSKPYLLYLSQTEEKSLYVLTDKGLYHHTLYGSTMEQLIDGSLCMMSDPARGFVNMLQIGEVFWVLYSGGQLRQYVYDAAVSAVPDNLLRVWGLYEDEDIQKVISAFGQMHPELYVTYEHPLGDDTGMTKEDAMKVLSTELATGNGPDVLLLDGLPYDTYVEKGVLADLTAALDGTGERYMEVVRRSYQRGGGQYAMPMSLSVPVLMGKREQIQGVSSLEQLADLVETARASQPEGSLLGFCGAEETLKLLAISSKDSWMNETGGMDREAVQEFLTQAKRIYDTHFSGLTARERDAMDMLHPVVNGQTFIRTEASTQLDYVLYFGQPYAVGMLSSNVSVVGGYSTVTTMLEMLDMDFVPMPGQSPNLGDASNILAVNEASRVKEQALELVIYALSARLVEESYIFSGSTNWDALDAQVKKERENEMGAGIGFEDINGKEIMINVDPPTDEDIQALMQLMETCQGVHQCDSRVYDAVIETGRKAMTGELTIEEAVKEIEKKVSLYLAE